MSNDANNEGGPRTRLGRREVLKGLAAVPAAAALGGKAHAQTLETRSQDAPSDAAPIRLALIGAGIIGFADVRTALQISGVQLVAAADLYDGRLQRVNEVFGHDVHTTRYAEEIYARDDVDAVIVATPDHWHAKLAIDAMQAGKHVYCEKPMVQRIDEGHAVIKAAEKTGKVLEVGSQYASSIVYEKAKELIQQGAIGKLNLIEAFFNRNSSIGAWNYAIPTDASPETLDWKRFVGHAPDHAYDADRFFRWRKYKDYGTGVGGDLFVHLITGVHMIMGSVGPTRVMATGGLRQWHDGRDVPDVLMALCEYPKTETHPEFTLSLQCNFADGGGGANFLRIVGSDGAMRLTARSIEIEQRPARPAPEEAVLAGYNSVFTFAEEEQERFAKAWRAERAKNPAPAIGSGSIKYRAPDDYDMRVDHFRYFFDAIRNGGTVLEDAEFGLRAAAPALLANVSQETRSDVRWDPVKMEITS